MVQRKELYENHLKLDFHKDEVKPYQMIENLVNQNQYKCFGFFENEIQKGYAYFVKALNGNTVLLDYFVVFSQFRNQGLGTVILEIIQEKLKEENDILLAEVENPKFATTDQSRKLQERRISFYHRNGFKMTKIQSCIIEDNYNIIYLPLNQSETSEKLYKELNQIYYSVFGEEFLKQNIKVELLL